ncbi:MAG: tRNA-dihydrouridine synthase family protein [Kiritimatiellae bacterium]|nr:tRNA-dihydrouridine synthase family protein [Kiritimatiellia bacterium]
MILAPLRGVTIRCFREVFAEQIREAGFTEAITPFLSANPGFDPLKDRELANVSHRGTKTQSATRNSVPPVALCDKIKVTPQFIGKDPASLRACLLRIKEVGYNTADLNCGCPYPMVRNKGRGSGLLRTPAVLEKMIAVGCETMGEGKFSVKTRLGFDKNDELLALMPMLNSFPLRFLTVHARNARQMYGGKCDWESFEKVAAVAKMPIVPNGDLPLQPSAAQCDQNCGSESSHRGTYPPAAGCPRSGCPSRGETQRVMIGRAFIRQLGMRDDIDELLSRYIDASSAELCGPSPVLGRMKELIAYWKDLPRWKRLWPVIKIARTLDELRLAY